jgi:hypothetical protein
LLILTDIAVSTLAKVGFKQVLSIALLTSVKSDWQQHFEVLETC